MEFDFPYAISQRGSLHHRAEHKQKLEFKSYLSIMEIKELIAKSKDLSFWHECRNNANYQKCATCDVGKMHSLMDCYDDYCKSYNSDLSPYSEVPVDASDIQSCIDFSNKCDQSLWMTRSSGTLSANKVKKDNVAGKVGEFVVMNTLVKMNVPVGQPDLNIYGSRQKSFDSDLLFTLNGVENGISVKTFRIHDGLPTKVSWVLQYSESDGRKGKDRHFFGSDDSKRINLWFAGVALSPDLTHGRILAFLSMQTLYDAQVYEPLEKQSFKDTKRAIYFSTLVQKQLTPLNTGVPFN